MTRKIESIKVQSNKYGTTVYVNFEGGRFGTHVFENGKWTDNRLSAEELAEAKKLAVVNKKWTNWTAPRQARCNGCSGKGTDQIEEGPLSTARDEREVAAKMAAVRTSEF